MKGLILTYLITAYACVASLRYPVIGLTAYVFFGILRPHFLFGFAGDIRGISDWLGAAMIIGWALNGFGSWKFGKARPVVAALLVFALWFVLSSFQALQPARSYTSIFTLSKLIVPILIGLTLLDTQVARRRMFWAIVLAQGYVGFEMNLEYLRGVNLAQNGFGGMDNNCFGASLVATIGPAVALAIASKTWYERLIASACAALILHTILLTFSRGAMVGFIAVGFAAVVMMPKRPKHLAAVLIVFAIAFRFTGPELAERYWTTIAPAEDRDASAESRIDLWRDCILVIEQYPIFGVGPANWRVIAASYGWPAGKSAHSVWLETAAETGIPGASILLLFFLIPIFRLWKLARERLTDENRWDVAIAMGTVLSAVGFVVAGQFVSVPALETPYYIVMVGAGVLKYRDWRAPVASETPQTGAPPQTYVPPTERKGGATVPFPSTAAAPGHARRLLALPGQPPSARKT
jgi:probable O-glycosylation ligase (exosortase A-associated)